MLTVATVIYIILAIFDSLLWPLGYIAGEKGCLGQIIVVVWAGLLFGGLSQ